MRLLVLGGTRFLGPHVVQRLIEQGHDVSVFYRGQSQAHLPEGVSQILGDRKHLLEFVQDFRQFSPEVLIDMIAYTEPEALATIQAFRGIARRLVVLSSMDVYRAYDRFRRAEPGQPDPVPLKEDAPLRTRPYPYRSHAKGENDLLYWYEKILVERAVMGQTDLAGTVLRLPCVYGPGDYQHRTFEYLKRMDDGRPAILLGEKRAIWRWSRGYVENVAAAIALAATEDRAAGQVYNVGEPDALTEAAWVGRIGQAASWAGQVVTLLEERLPAHLRMPYEWSQDLVGDTTKLSRELGYEEPIGMEPAMARTVAWERVNPPAQFDAGLFDYATEDVALGSL